MALLIKRNQPYIAANQTGAQIWFDFIEDMIAQGWRVLGSSDGVTFENQGQKVLGAAFGRLVTPGPGSLLDGETFTLDDGSAPVTFEFDTVPDGVTGGNVVVDISATSDEFGVRAAIVAAINTSSLGITASLGYRAGLDVFGGDPANTAVVLLHNDLTGVGGNTLSSETVANSDFTVTDMTGGGTAPAGSGGAYHLHLSANAPIDASAPYTAGTYGNVSGGFPDARGASWIRLATPVDAEHYVELVFQPKFEVIIGADDTMHVIMCRDTQRFDAGADQWQRPAVNSGVALRFGTQRTAHDPEKHSDEAGAANFLPQDDAYCHWLIGDKDQDYDFIFYCSRAFTATSSGHVHASFGRFRVVGGTPRSDGSPDPDPYVWFTNFASSPAAIPHNFNNDTLLTVDQSGTLFPARLESRSVSGASLVDTVMSFGIDDPAVALETQGHYGGALLSLFIRVPGPADLWQDMNSADQATGRVIVDTLIRAGKVRDAVNHPQRFYKGAFKNDLIGWSSRQRELPTVLKHPSHPAEPIRVAWGHFCLIWGAEERVLGI